MPETRADLLTRASTKAAEEFVDAYYTALQASRGTIAFYYVPKDTLPDGKVVPVIIWNGNFMDDVETFQKMFENDMPYTYYEVQSLDCHVLNPNYYPANSEKTIKDGEKNISIAVTVSGYVRLEEAREGPMKGFSETFVLAPNADKAAARGPLAQRRSWLIQNQNFRYVV